MAQEVAEHLALVGSATGRSRLRLWSFTNSHHAFDDSKQKAGPDPPESSGGSLPSFARFPKRRPLRGASMPCKTNLLFPAGFLVDGSGLMAREGSRSKLQPPGQHSGNAKQTFCTSESMLSTDELTSSSVELIVSTVFDRSSTDD
jgi:hypothetical protein